MLDELAALGAKPLQTRTVAQARTHPTPSDAVKSLLAKQGKNTAPEAVGSVEDRSFPGPGGSIPIRIYKPAGAGPFPVALYIHGGGWVIATIDTYDSSARALTNAAGAIIVSTHYRQAPENEFPAAHDDAYAAYQWTLANATSLGGIAKQVAVIGESAGGNMATGVAIRARDNNIQRPVHQALIYPVTNYAYDSPSQIQNRDAAPLGTTAVMWFYDKYLPTPADGANPCSLCCALHRWPTFPRQRSSQQTLTRCDPKAVRMRSGWARQVCPLTTETTPVLRTSSSVWAPC